MVETINNGLRRENVEKEWVAVLTEINTKYGFVCWKNIYILYKILMI